jgi:RHS repeat-associated protein
MASTLGLYNPLRYRGYVYDTELGLYYLQSRYYNPTWGRFINADALVSTGQGILGNNMFAYCRNNPVSRKDAAGTDDICVTANEDNNLFNDVGGDRGGLGGGAGGGADWGSFIRTLQSALDGLNMAMGQRNMSHTEKHHLISDKLNDNNKYKPQYQEIIDRNNYSLDHESNLVTLEGHRGRHTNAYHDFMIFAITELDTIAAGDPSVFIEGMKKIGGFVLEHSWIPYARTK